MRCLWRQNLTGPGAASLAEHFEANVRFVPSVGLFTYLASPGATSTVDPDRLIVVVSLATRKTSSSVTGTVEPLSGFWAPMVRCCSSLFMLFPSRSNR